ncbi:MAG: hypothetical protein JNG86_12855, partial [Verrucomicrobiaceae bacterium]|nr:hypothetical protein [Verrucomicrobiaceae bacterium]
VTVTAGNVATPTYTYALPLTPQELWRQELFGSPSNTGSGADSADPDGDGFTNVAEFTAGTHPLRSFDHFKTENPLRSGNVFSVGTSGKAGRTYVLERSVNLASGTWTTIATQGPLTYDTALTLHDAASPPGAAFYRIRVTGP